MSEQVGMQIEEPAAAKAADLSSFAEMFQTDLSPVSCDSVGEPRRGLDLRREKARKEGIIEGFCGFAWA